MTFLQETDQERAMRRIVSCTHTLYSVADELLDPEDVDQRADLLIAVENLIDVANHVTEAVREIAWQYSPVPGFRDDDEDDDY
jgi:hypothetical protein